MAFPRTKPVELTLDSAAKPPVKKDIAPRKNKATVRINLWFVDDVDTIEVGTFYKYRKMHVKGIGRNQSDVTTINDEFCITSKNECVSKNKTGALWVISKYPETELIVCSNETQLRIDREKLKSLNNVKEPGSKQYADDCVSPGQGKIRKAGPGRPLGSRNVKTCFLEALGDERASKVVDMLWDKAKAGCIEALMFIADRIYPKGKTNTYTDFDLGDTKTMGGLNDAMERVLDAVSDSVLTHEEAERLMEMLERKRKFIFENRLQVMLDAMKMKNENLNIAEVMKFYE